MEPVFFLFSLVRRSLALHYQKSAGKWADVWLGDRSAMEGGVCVLHSTFIRYLTVVIRFMVVTLSTTNTQLMRVFFAFFLLSIPITHPISITGLKLNRSIAMVNFFSTKLTVFDFLCEMVFFLLFHVCVCECLLGWRSARSVRTVNSVFT